MFPSESETTDSTANTFANFTQIDYVQRADWIIPIVINILLLLLSAWVLISVVHYGIKTKKWSKTHASNEEKLSAGLVYTSIVICAGACLLRYIATLFYFNIGYSYNEDRICDILSDLTSTLYTFVLFSSALFSWSRQRLFYSNHMLNVNYSKAVRFFSQSSIVIIVVCGLGVLIFNVVPDDHPSSPEGCTYEIASYSLRIAYWVSIVLAIVFGQVVVLYLFVHALYTLSPSSSEKRSSAASETGSLGVSHSSDHLSAGRTTNGHRMKSTQITFEGEMSPVHTMGTRKNASKTNSVKRILRITFVSATISLLVDILIQVFSFFISSGNRRALTTLLNISSFLNLLLIVFAFKKYKQMLFSCFYKK